MQSDKAIPTTIRLSPHYREELQRRAAIQKTTLGNVARDIIRYDLEGGPNQALADSIAELKKELDSIRKELSRRDSVDKLRDDLWAVLGTILVKIGNCNEAEVKELIKDYRKKDMRS